LPDKPIIDPVSKQTLDQTKKTAEHKSRKQPTMLATHRILDPSFSQFLTKKDNLLTWPFLHQPH
jgi:hypothetical protein